MEPLWVSVPVGNGGNGGNATREKFLQDSCHLYV
ncbi:hypothetical protein SLEP1_g22559 [Rubroshorea leprosula]|uniref:Uncharacterized protein n=1 Tax=Rubroshorea leprosula TaxID=152421 RepID=A0AAV5JIT7_9ROSI|nr:hypothetical protein SLEP1_g22559 [Rubroshorea leprosula]